MASRQFQQPYSEKINHDGTKLSKSIHRYLSLSPDLKLLQWEFNKKTMRDEYKFTQSAYRTLRNNHNLFKQLIMTKPDYDPNKSYQMNNGMVMDEYDYKKGDLEQRKNKTYCNLIDAIINKQKQKSRYYLEQYKSLIGELLEQLYCENFDTVKAYILEKGEYVRYKRDEYILEKSNKYKNNIEAFEFRIFIMMDLF